MTTFHGGGIKVPKRLFVQETLQRKKWVLGVVEMSRGSLTGERAVVGHLRVGGLAQRRCSGVGRRGGEVEAVRAMARATEMVNGAVRGREEREVGDPAACYGGGAPAGLNERGPRKHQGMDTWPIGGGPGPGRGGGYWTPTKLVLARIGWQKNWAGANGVICD